MGDEMSVLTIRRVPEETHRALRLRAAQNGRSMAAEIRSILDTAVRPSDRIKLGTELNRISQEIGGIDDLNIERDRSPLKG